MKRLVYLGLILITGLSFNTLAQESDSTGMPGDNFDLQGALNLFKESKNLEDFEKKLNSESSKVNNLDLDGDNKIDYIRVVDKKDGDNHAILLQVPVNKKENQDIAAIAIEKRSGKEAQLQIIGNESIYGEETIMEPIDEKEVKQSSGPSTLSPVTFVYVNVWYWPCVQYIYDPFYDPWYSPYYWDYYPSWWNPWRPVYYYVYYDRMYYYHGWCHYTPYYHVPHAHALYVSNHSNSNTIRKRYEPQRSAYKGRSVYNQSANGSKGRVETGTKSEPVNPNVRTKGANEVTRPTTRQPEQNNQNQERTAPRPVNRDNNGGTIHREEPQRTNNGTIRKTEPVRNSPNVPQQRQPVERAPQRTQPQRTQPQPQRQQQQQPVIRPSSPSRAPATSPSNGGGRRGR